MDEYKGKRLLILGGASVHCKVVQAAKEMGIYTVVTDYLVDSPAKKMADKSYMLNIYDVDGIVEMCREEKIDGVIGPYIDPCQRPYFEICHRLDLPCYMGSREQLYALTNKTAFKELCVKNGLDVIPTYDLDHPEEIRYPVLVKPAESRGSRGQAVCSTLEEVRAACAEAEKVSDNGQAIIEKYMGSKGDLAVTYFFANGEAFLIRTADRYLGKAELGMEKVAMCEGIPSRYNRMYREHIDAKMVNMLKTLGVKNGPVFVQGFVDGDKLRFYDPGFRFPGTEFHVALEAVEKINLDKMLIEFAVTGQVSDRHGRLHHNIDKFGGKTTVELFPCLRPGKITKISGLEEVAQMDSVIYTTQRYFEGEQMGFYGNVTQRLAEIDVICDTAAQMRRTIREIQSKLKVLDENGEDMIFSELDADAVSFG